MIKQIIRGEKMVPVKYHGQVKFIVFECNNCHKEFEKPQSYFKKQMKKRTFACCFCSPRCRSIYYSSRKFNESPKSVMDVISQGPVIKTVVSPDQVIHQEKKTGFFESLKKFFS